ncbi:hypothetical protein, partial [Mitsuaria sp. TWR114]|uniref:hypothetical protein n=1 Tax=Mitsuaria sp. TWR114 TaxID=2601731 RepID=UPI001C9A993D
MGLQPALGQVLRRLAAAVLPSQRPHQGEQAAAGGLQLVGLAQRVQRLGRLAPRQRDVGQQRV